MSMHFQSIQPSATSLQAEVDHLVALYQRGRLTEVAQRCEKLVRRHPRLDMLYNILGAACIGLEDFAKADTALAKAAMLDPSDAEIHNNHGIALGSLGRLEEAIAAYRRALAIRPDYAEAHYNLGNACRK